jgi:hypothetical protein
MTPPSLSASGTLKFSMRFSTAVCFCRRFVPMAPRMLGCWLLVVVVVLLLLSSDQQ